MKWFMEPKFQSSEATTSKAVSSHFKSRTTASPWSEDSYDQTDFKLLPEFKNTGLLTRHQSIAFIWDLWGPWKNRLWWHSDRLQTGVTGDFLNSGSGEKKFLFTANEQHNRAPRISFISLLPAVFISNAWAMLLICISVSTPIRAKHAVELRLGMNIHLEPSHHKWISLKCDLPRPILSAHTDHLAGITCHNTSMKEMGKCALLRKYI